MCLLHTQLGAPGCSSPVSTHVGIFFSLVAQGVLPAIAAQQGTRTADAALSRVPHCIDLTRQAVWQLNKIQSLSDFQPGVGVRRMSVHVRHRQLCRAILLLTWAPNAVMSTFRDQGITLLLDGCSGAWTAFT